MYIKLKELTYDELSQIISLLSFLNDDRIDANAARIIYKTFYETNFIVKFDWSKWERGRKIINNSESIKTADILTLRMLVTTIICNDRFNEGSFEKALENGVMKEILCRAKELQEFV